MFGFLLLVIRFLIFIISSLLVLISLKIVNFIFFKSKKTSSKLNRIIFKSWSVILIKSFGGKIEIKDWQVTKNTIFLSNHISYLDIIILNAIHPFAFVAKSEIAKWPLFGPMSRSVGTIFIDRSNPLAVKNLYKKIDDKIKYGDSVLIFPEGTTSNGEEILDFKKAVFMPVLRAKASSDSLGCIAIKYKLDKKYGEQKDKIAWWGDDNFFEHFIKLLQIPSWKIVISAKEYKVGDVKSSGIISKETNEIVRKEFSKI